MERGLTRVGSAWIGDWGWLELDVIIGFPLKTPILGIDWHTTADVRLGGIFPLTERLELGAGFSTDFSPESTPTEFADTQVNYYRVTI